MAYFPACLGVNAMDLIVTEEGSYSVTKPRPARQIVNFIVDTANKNKVSCKEIIDATACIGGDTLSFLQSGMFGRVTAVEMNWSNYKALVHNMREFGYTNGRRLRMLDDDYTYCFKRFKSEIVYMDAPWGGPGYKNKTNLMLYMSGMSVDRLTRAVLEAGNAQLVALKVPGNFAFGRFRHTLSKCRVANAVQVHRLEGETYKLITVVAIA